MPQLETLIASVATPILLSYLDWCDIVALASASTQLFRTTKKGQNERREDVSGGISPYPIPCDPPTCTPRVLYQASRCFSGTGQRCKWNLDGPLPPSFKYLNEAIYYFHDPGDDILEGCSCFGQCGDQDEEDTDNLIPCLCMQLNAAAQSGPAPLFECHSDCLCDPVCRLRPTQRGKGRWEKVPPMMRLRYMGSKGWGAYAVDAIPAGTFVADYTGEVLPLDEARRRVDAYDRGGLNYMLTTQEFFQGGKEVCQTIVDATTSGNVSRFFNHCCDPNLSVFVVRRGSFRRPRLAFFTRNRVEAGSELTYDYGAAGSAGGAVSHDSDNDRQNSSSSPQPIRKTPRTSRSSRSNTLGTTTPRGKTSDGNRSLSSRAREEKMDEHGVEQAAGRSTSDDVSSHQALTPRRACLCGSRCCRGLLPYSRAIL